MQSTYYWLLNQGLQSTILILLIYLPIIATFVNIARYIIGTKTFGIYAPLMLTVAYIFTGIRIGLITTITVILATFISYSMLKKIRMHYVSRITITYIFSSIAIILEFLLIGYLKIPLTILPQITAVPPLGIVLITTLSDFFIKQYIKKGTASTIRALTGAVSIATIAWAIIRFFPKQDLIINNAGLILLSLIPINLLIGQFSGLKLKDFIRFKNLIVAND